MPCTALELSSNDLALVTGRSVPLTTKRTHRHIDKALKDTWHIKNNPDYLHAMHLVCCGCKLPYACTDVPCTNMLQMVLSYRIRRIILGCISRRRQYQNCGQQLNIYHRGSNGSCIGLNPCYVISMWSVAYDKLVDS